MNETERVIVRPRGAATPLRKGVYLLPNLITTAGLFAGFYSIIRSEERRVGKECRL